MRRVLPSLALASLGLGGLGVTVACSGSVGGSGAISIAYPNSVLRVRAGESFSTSPTIIGGASSILRFEISPALPSGFQLDPSTGAISGSGSALVPRARYRVAIVGAGRELASLDLDFVVGPALPPGVTALEGGWVAETYAMAQATKIAHAPDGRVFFTELATGRVRIVGADRTIAATSFATRPVLSGGHRGLLGIALAPDFETSRHVFAMACAPAAGAQGDRVQILRWTEENGIGTQETVLLDDLPIGVINNGGALCFDASGMLLASLGDVQDPAKSQDQSSPAGKVLRLTREGAVPNDNPFAGSHVYALGLRNVFAMCIEPVGGGIFAADNGPASNDELVYIQAGRNYQWGASSEVDPIGFTIRTWPTVIVPTAMRFHHGQGVSDRYAGALFVAHYDDEGIRRVQLSGPEKVDCDAEHEHFCVFGDVDGGENKPTDLVVMPDGSMLVATFRRIYRLWQL